MTAESDHLDYRRLRAPRESGTGLVEPAWDTIAETVATNLRRSSQSCYDVQGKCLSQLAREARTELLESARSWTSTYRDVGEWAYGDLGRVFLAGHQPQMFHPGVWLKNFALGRLAQIHGAVGVNLIVDSDTIRTNTIRVPGAPKEAPSIVEIPFDAGGPTIPFEERRILDRNVFEAFGEHVERQIKPLVDKPLVGEYWRHVRDRSREDDRLGMCLAQARHVLEDEWLSRTLEVPQSEVCDSDSFRWFTCHLLNQANRFRQVHNEVLANYRRVHRIRSAAHPVADLTEQGPWRETPFWIWTVENPRRRGLFVKQTKTGLCLSNLRDLEIPLPMSGDGDVSPAIECLRVQHTKGVRIRSRALITTMWARLALGDLFLHGIGGAKYDQVTDAIIACFTGIDPPAYLTLSGTLHLPVPHCEGAAEEVHRLQDRLRRLKFQPERFLNNSIEARQLVEQKWDWINKNVTPTNYRERFLSIRRLNESLQRWVEPARAETQHALDIAKQASRTASILTWREYAFCLFSGEGLQDFFSKLLPKPA